MNEDPGSGTARFDTHSAFVTADSNMVTKSRDQDKPKRGAVRGKSDSSPGKKKLLADITCLVCGLEGHYAWNCRDKKADDKVLVTTKTTALGSDNEYEDEEEENETVYVTTCEKVMFSRYDVLLDSQASVNVFCNRNLLKNVRESDRQIVLNGVQAGADGFSINLEGDFDEVGKAYFSKDSSANILSYAVMVDQGNNVTYDQPNDKFLLRPLGIDNVYSFCRKNVEGSENRFDCCNVKSMVDTLATTYPPCTDIVLSETETDNMMKYTKREIDGA